MENKNKIEEEIKSEENDTSKSCCSEINSIHLFEMVDSKIEELNKIENIEKECEDRNISNDDAKTVFYKEGEKNSFEIITEKYDEKVNEKIEMELETIHIDLEEYPQKKEAIHENVTEESLSENKFKNLRRTETAVMKKQISRINHLEAEKLNEDIPYINDVNTKMYRSPVMPLRIEALHSLEDSRLRHGNPDWLKYLCPLCDKAFYYPNVYTKNYNHYMNEHWAKRKVCGGFVLFPCRLLHTNEEIEETNELMKKGKNKKKGKTIQGIYHYHCPLCENKFQCIDSVKEHCKTQHTSTPADPTRAVPANYVHTPFIFYSDYYTELKRESSTSEGKGEIEENVDNQLKISNKRIKVYDKDENEKEKNEHINNNTKVVGSRNDITQEKNDEIIDDFQNNLDNEKVEEEKKKNNNKRRKSKVIFCDKIKVREYDIELSKVEKTGATMGPVYTDDEKKKESNEKVKEIENGVETKKEEVIKEEIEKEEKINNEQASVQNEQINLMIDTIQNTNENNKQSLYNASMKGRFVKRKLHTIYKQFLSKYARKIKMKQLNNMKSKKKTKELVKLTTNVNDLFISPINDSFCMENDEEIFEMNESEEKELIIPAKITLKKVIRQKKKKKILKNTERRKSSRLKNKNT